MFDHSVLKKKKLHGASTEHQDKHDLYFDVCCAVKQRKFGCKNSMQYNSSKKNQYKCSQFRLKDTMITYKICWNNFKINSQNIRYNQLWECYTLAIDLLTFCFAQCPTIAHHFFPDICNIILDPFCPPEEIEYPEILCHHLFIENLNLELLLMAWHLWIRILHPMQVVISFLHHNYKLTISIVDKLVQLYCITHYRWTIQFSNEINQF